MSDGQMDGFVNLDLLLMHTRLMLKMLGNDVTGIDGCVSPFASCDGFMTSAKVRRRE